MPSIDLLPFRPPGAFIKGGAPRHFLLLAGITVLAVGLSLLAITPRVIFWKDYSLLTFETGRRHDLVAQLEDPISWNRGPNARRTENALSWRLLPPVIGHTLHLPPKVYLGLPWLGLFLLVGTSLHYLRQRGVSPLGLLAAGVLTGTSAAFFGSSTSLGYFDCLYLLALVVFCFSPSLVLTVASCLLGPWIDEKFLLMLPACFFLRWSWQPSWRWVGGAALAVLLYSGIRLSAVAAGDSTLARQIAIQGPVFERYWRSLPVAWWYAFRLGWFFIGAGIWLVARQLNRPARVLMLASLAAGMGAVSFLAWDTTRSIAMVFPFFLAGASAPRLQRALVWLAILNPFLPAAYLITPAAIKVPLTSCLK